LFDRHGFGGITMVALAAEAGVSRQLVYDHFADLSGLYTAFVEDRLAGYAASSTAAAAHDGSVSGAVREHFRHLLTVPEADRRIIRLVVTDTGVADLDGARRLLLDHELARWTSSPGSPARSRRPAETMVWTLMSALLALAHGVAIGDLSPEVAEDAAVDLAGAVMSGARARTLAPDARRA
jgi:AcrR family transcriptional regulator